MRTGILLVSILLCSLALLAGCVSEEQGPQPTPTPVVTVVTTPALPPYLQKGPVDTIPPEKRVSVTIRRDQITPEITARFDGGNGQQQVREIQVKLTRSDGTSETKTLEAKVNAEIKFQGTKGVDRVEIRVSYLDGTSYRLSDSLYDFYAR